MAEEQNEKQPVTLDSVMAAKHSVEQAVRMLIDSFHRTYPGVGIDIRATTVRREIERKKFVTSADINVTISI